MIKRISDKDSLKETTEVIKNANATVAKDFGLTMDNCPAHPAFITFPDLEKLFDKGLEFYAFIQNGQQAGAIAVEKSSFEKNTFYLEKVAVLPEFRKQGIGEALVKFGLNRIKELKGKRVSIAVIDNHFKLKKWYCQLGFKEFVVKEYAHLPFKVCFMEIQF